MNTVELTLDQKTIEDAIKNVATTDDQNSTPLTPGKAAAEAIKSLYNVTKLSSIDRIMEFDETIERRAIMIEDIDEGTGPILENFIRFWNRIDSQNDTPIEQREPIKIYINSYGGVLTSTFTAVDAIQGSDTPVYTINIGCAYSGGFLILISGHKRFGLTRSSYLYHEGAVGTQGDANKFQNFADFYKKQREQIKELTIHNTKIAEEDYNNHIKDDWWFSAEEALEYGVIDEIVRNSWELK